jgi:membrane fusion protein (multidrug efflux system)
MLETAQLNQTYTVITAAIDGQVSKIDDIQPDSISTTRTITLSSIIIKAWVIANFKKHN